MTELNKAYLTLAAFIIAVLVIITVLVSAKGEVCTMQDAYHMSGGYDERWRHCDIGTPLRG